MNHYFVVSTQKTGTSTPASVYGYATKEEAESALGKR